MSSMFHIGTIPMVQSSQGFVTADDASGVNTGIRVTIVDPDISLTDFSVSDDRFELVADGSQRAFLKLKVGQSLCEETSVNIIYAYAFHTYEGTTGYIEMPLSFTISMYTDGDFIHGYSGDDTLNGGAGDDKMYGVEGDDTLSGGAGDDNIIGGLGDDTIYGGVGDDRLDGDGTTYDISEGGDDTLYGGDGDDRLFGHAGDDTLYGGDGDDYLSGNIGDDMLYGNAGDDRLSGWRGNDHLYGGDGDDILYSGEGDDRLYGNAGDDTLEGGSGDDWLIGWSGDDTLYGGEGNDWLLGGIGADTFVLGVGGDTVVDFTPYHIAITSSGITSTPDNGDKIRIDSFTGTMPATVEELLTATNLRVVKGHISVDGFNSDTDDATTENTAIYRGNTLRMVLEDFDDDLTLDMFDLPNATTDIIGTPGDDTLNGGSDDDTIRGTPGDDTLNGGSDDDTIRGRGGDDTIDGGDGDDDIRGGSGDDTIDGGGGDDEIRGRGGDDTIDGGSGDDELRGNRGDDAISGSGGDDDLHGGKGDDTIYGDEGNDILRGKAGDDTLYGGRGDDTFYGKAGDDTLYGGAGDDELRGGKGDDILYGGSGDDTLTGGKGADIFVLNTDATGTDTITDFNANDGDKIRVETFAGTMPRTVEAFLTAANLRVVKGHISVDGLNSTTDKASKQNTAIYKGDTLLMVLEDFEDDLTLDMFDLPNATAIPTNNAPTFAQDSYSATIVETAGTGSASIGRVLVAVQASDADAGDTLTYSITAGNDARLFAINEDGEITLAVPDVRTNPATHTLMVTATDGVGNSDTATVTITDSSIRGTDDEESMTGGNEQDFIYGYGGDDVLYGGDGDDYLSGGDDDDTLYGGEGNDYVGGGRGDDILYGADGNDRISGYYGDDTLYGGDGDDVLYGGHDDDTLYGGAGDDRLDGGYDRDTLYGGAGNDYLYGNYGYDILIGGVGNNILRGGRDVDIFVLNTDASGVDTVVDFYGIDYGGWWVGTSRIRVYVDDATETDTLEELYAAANIREEQGHIQVEGQNSSYDDETKTNTAIYKIVGEADSAENGKTDDVLIMVLEDVYRPLTRDDFEVVEGSIPNGTPNQAPTFAQETYTATIVRGAESGDIITNIAATDPEGDTLTYAITAGNDAGLFIVDATNGDIKLATPDTRTDAGDHTLTLTVTDSAGNTATATVTITDYAIRGTDGDDLHTANGLYGDDEGDDTIYGNAGDDHIRGGAGDDTLYGGAGDDRVFGDGGDDTIYGGAGDDHIFAEGGNDTLYGGRGDDYVSGGDGGTNLLYGGAGADLFEVGVRFVGTDIVVDFNAEDDDHLELFIYADGNFDASSLEALLASGGFRLDTSGNKIIEGYESGENDADIHDTVIYYEGHKGETVIAVLEDFTDLTYDMFNLKIYDFGDDDNTIRGTAEVSNHISGGHGDDTLYGGSGEDRLNGGFGDDHIYGGAGYDRIQGSVGDDTLYGGDGDDRFWGSTGDDILYGGADNDWLYGGDGDDTLYGGDGDDILVGDAYGRDGGADIFALNADDAGVDIVRGFAPSDGDKIRVDAFTGTIPATIEAFFTTANLRVEKGHIARPNYDSQRDDESIENTAIYSGDTLLMVLEDFTDDLTLDMFDLPNADTNNAPTFAQNSYSATIAQGAEIGDIITNIAATDADADAVTYSITAGNDAGLFIVDATNGDIKLATPNTKTDAGDHTITITATDTAGNSATATVTITDYAIRGTDAQDALHGTTDGDTIYGYGGSDTITGGDGSDVLWGGSGVDIIYGGGATDVLSGGEGDDIIYGGDGDDVIYGNEGDDTIYGGAGRDLIKGQGGADSFVLNTDATSSADMDVIGGFSVASGDKIRVESFNGVMPKTIEAFLAAANLRAETGEFDNFGTNNTIIYKVVGGDNGESDDIALMALVYFSEDLTLDMFDLPNATANQAPTFAQETYTATIAQGAEVDDITEVGDIITNIVATDADGDTLTYSITAGNDAGLFIVDATNGDIKLATPETPTDATDHTLTITATDTAGNSATATVTITDYAMRGTDGEDSMTGSDETDFIYGYGGDDILNGGAGEDWIDGYDGDDMLYGGDDADAVWGGGGADTLYGGAGDDWLFGEGDDDRLYGGDGGDVLYGNEGDDRLSGDAGGDWLYGQDGDDRLYGNDGDDWIAGHSGDDTLSGGAGDDTLRGDSGGDDLHGGAGDDVLYGSGGDDTLYGDAGDDTLHGGSASDVLYGDAGADTLNGSYGGDVIYGGADNDILNGGAGNDLLEGSAGTDTLYGGAGSDYLRGDSLALIGTEIFTGPADADIFVLNTADSGTDTITDFTPSAGDKIRIEEFTGAIPATVEAFLTAANLRVEKGHIKVDAWANINIPTDDSAITNTAIYSGDRLVMVLEDFTDDLTLDMFDLPNATPNTAPVFTQTSYTETIAWTPRTDIVRTVAVVSATDADGDTLTYAITAGNDAGLFDIDGQGNITLAVPDEPTDATDHTLTVTATDTAGNTATATVTITDFAIRGTDDGETITGSDERDVIYGYGGDDTLYGGDGNDLIHGTAGDDIIYGGAGRDILVGGNNNDYLYGGAGDDELRGGYGDDTLDGGAGDDKLYGGGGDDTLYGGEGNDALAGHEGDDTLDGGEGVDGLYGWSGDDTLYGGAGDDYLVGGAGADIFVLGSGDDTVRDFTPSDGDKIRVADFTGVMPRGIEAFLTAANLRVEKGHIQIDELFNDNYRHIYLGHDSDTTENTAIYKGDKLLMVLEDFDADLTLDMFDLPNATPNTAPVFTQTSYTATLAESAAIGSAVVAVQASDADAGDTLTYSITGGDGLFAINNDGEITLTGALDYETATSHTLTVQVEDSGGLTTATTTEVTINVTDVTEPNIIRGTDEGDRGSTRLIGTDDADAIYGLGGHDDILGNAGDDTLYGGSGDDKLSGGDGNDVIYGGSGRDGLYDYFGGINLFHGGLDADFFFFAVGSDHASNDVSTNIIVDFNTEDGDAIGLRGLRISGTFEVSSLEELASTAGLRFDTSGNKVIKGHESGENDADINDMVIYKGDAVVAVLEDFTDLTLDMIYLVVTGSDDDDIIYGGDGGNQIEGKGGDDKIYGGAGKDYLYGFSGDDTIYGGASDDHIQGMDGDDTLYGGDGDDSLVGGSGTNQLNGGAGNDYLVGDSDIDQLNGGAGNDALHGNDGDDVLYGGAGNDALNGQGGADIFVLNADDAGVDIVRDFTPSDGDNSDGDKIRVAEFDGVIPGSIEAFLTAANLRVEKGHITRPNHDSYRDSETIENTAIYSGDTLVMVLEDFTADLTLDMFDLPNATPNTAPVFTQTSYTATLAETAAIGSAVIAMQAADVDAGDTLTYSITGGDGLFAINNDGEITLTGALDFETATSHTITVQVEDSAGATDTTEVTINVTNTIFRGWDGSDAVDLRFRDDYKWDTIYGLGGDDRLLGGTRADTIYGGAGDDEIGGYGGDDRLYGGEGDDYIRGWAGDDKIYGGAGDDRLYGQTGRDLLKGGAGKDLFIVSAYPETNTAADSDVIVDLSIAEGERLELLVKPDDQGVFRISSFEDFETAHGVRFDTSGNKIIEGHESGENDADINDTVIYRGDVIVAVIEDAHITFDMIDWEVIGGADADTLYGGEGDDLVLSMGGNDALYGLGGDDILSGGDGDDFLDGGSGQNVLMGKDGADTFVLNLDGSSTTTISDFGRGNDKISLVIDELTISALNRLFSNDLRVERAHTSMEGFVDPYDRDSIENTIIYKVVGEADSTTNGESDDVLLVVLQDFDDALTYQMFGLSAGGDIVLTATNQAPIFAQDSYTATIARGAEIGDIITNIAATDADDDTLTYSITAGNDSGLFIVDATNGDIKLATPDERTDAGDHTLTITATDSTGNTDTATVTITDYAIRGTGGNDESATRIRGTDGADVIYGYGGDDKISGGAGGDNIFYGGAGDDNLWSWAGNDILYGGAGSDILTGNLGIDLLYGGAGGDVFSGNISIYAINNIVVDFSADEGDRIELQLNAEGTFQASSLEELATAAGLRFDTSGNKIIEGHETGENDANINDMVIYRVETGNIAFVLEDFTDLTIDMIDLSILGADGDDTFYGGNGDDRLNGGDGDDRLDGGSGDDRLHGLGGDDRLDGGSGDDFVTGFKGDDVLDGGSGDDELQGGGGDDRLDGGDGDDVLSGDYGNDTLYGGAGFDTIYGFFGEDTLHGGDGTDYLIGGDDADIFVLNTGDSGFDAVADFTPGGGDKIRVEEFDGVIPGTIEAFLAAANLRVEKVYISDGVFVADDSLGIHTAIYASADSATNGESGDRLVMVLEDFEDDLTLDMFDLPNATANNAPVFTQDSYTADSYRVEGWTVRLDASGTAVVVSATDADGDAVTYAITAGNDAGFFDIGATNGTISFGAPDVQIHAATHTLTVTATDTAGNTDTATVTVTDGAIRGTDNEETLTGSDDSDHIYGYDGDDTLYGGGGDDHIWDNAGDDTLYGGAGDDWLGGGDGDDTLYGVTGNNGLYGHGGDDTLYAGDGGDGLSGGDGDDTLYGSTGGDHLNGGAGDDWLEGGAGKDYLHGGGGADIFMLGSGEDRLGDFTPSDGDKIRVTDFTGTIPGSVEAFLTAANLRVEKGHIKVEGFNSGRDSTATENTAIYRGDTLLMVLEDFTDDLTLDMFDLPNATANQASTFTLSTLYTTGNIAENSAGAETGIIFTVTGDTPSQTNPIFKLSDDRFEIVEHGNNWRLKLKADVALNYEDENAPSDGYVIDVSVEDDAGNTSRMVSVVVTVSDANDIPTFNPGFYDVTIPADATFDSKIDIELEASDEDGDSLTYFILTESNADGLFTIAPNSGEIKLAIPTAVTSYGTYTLKVQVGDAKGITATSPAIVTITDSAIRGTDSVNTLTGTSLADTIYGYGGADTIYGDAGNDILNGGRGDDTLRGGGGEFDILRGGAGNDTLYGDGGSDLLEGDRGDDMLYGGEGFDYLYGGIGDDTVNGGRGSDHMGGGYGADIFVLNTADSGIDSVFDFTPSDGDKIRMAEFNGTMPATIEAFLVAANLRVEQNHIKGDEGSEHRNLLSDDSEIANTAIYKVVDGADDVLVMVLEDFTEDLTLDMFDLPNATANSAPTFAQDSYTASLAENAEAGSAVVTVQATDANAGDTLTYSIVSNNIPGLFVEDTIIDNAPPFAIDANTGAITLTGALDFETATTHTFTIQVEDSAGLTDTATITINVTDSAIRGTDDDDRIGGTADADTIYGYGGDDFIYAQFGDDTLYGGAGNDVLHGSGDNDTLYGGAGDDTLDGGAGLDTHYGGDGDDEFALDIHGLIQGHITDDSHADTLKDFGNGNDKIHIHVPASVIPSLDVTISSLEQLYSIFNLRVEKGHIAVDGLAGNIDDTAIENTAIYSGDVLLMVLEDFTADLTLNMFAMSHGIINRAPEFAQETYTATLAETAETGSAVVTVAATDADIDDTLTYSIIGGDGGGDGLFAINDDGEITLTGALDYETATSHNLTIKAQDKNGDTDTAKVVVHVTDANDNAPIFDAATHKVEIPELTEIGTVLTTVTARDADTSGVRYSIIGGRNANLFNINEISGAITLKGFLDFETAESHRLVVQASDGVSTDTINVIIGVVDEMDCACLDIAANTEEITAGTVLTASITHDDPNGYQGGKAPESGWVWFYQSKPDQEIGDGSSTYTVREEDSGEQICVRITYMDGNGRPEIVQARLEETVQRVVIKPDAEDADKDKTYTAEADKATKVEAGTGADHVRDGLRNDVIDGGKGDDEIDLSASKEDNDVVVYGIGNQMASDGADSITSFVRGRDKFVFQLKQSDIDAGNIDLSQDDGYEGFINYVTKGTEDLIDDQFWVNFNFSIGENGVQMDGISFHFKDSTFFSGGRISMPIVSIEFADPLSVDEVREVYSGRDKSTPLVKQGLLSDFDYLDDFLGGDGAIGFDII